MPECISIIHMNESKEICRANSSKVQLPSFRDFIRRTRDKQSS
jgi:hypothetical protein